MPNDGKHKSTIVRSVGAGVRLPGAPASLLDGCAIYQADSPKPQFSVCYGKTPNRTYPHGGGGRIGRDHITLLEPSKSPINCYYHR